MVLTDPEHLTRKRLAEKAQRLRTGMKLQIDGTGLALISIGLASLEIVLDKGQELDWLGSTFIAWAAAIAFLALAGAVAWELRVKNPVVNLRLLKERNFAFCCVIVLGVYTALYASTFLLPQFMQLLMGYSATAAGLAISPAGLFTIIEVPLVGWALSRGFDARRMIFAGLATIALGTWWLSLGNLDMGESSLIWPRVVQVLGIGMTTVPLSTIMFRFLPTDQSSNAAGIYALVRNEGGSIGIAISSTFLERTAQTHQAYIGAHISASNPLALQRRARPRRRPRHHRLQRLSLQQRLRRPRHALRTSPAPGRPARLHGPVPHVHLPPPLPAPARLPAQAAEDDRQNRA